MTGARIDEEVRRFLEEAPRHLTYSQLEALCRERFGADRAPSRAEIAAYWKEAHPPRMFGASPIDADAELRDFVDDRLGRMALRKITAACRAHFGAGRAPSRSAIHRYHTRQELQRWVAGSGDAPAKPR